MKKVVLYMLGAGLILTLIGTIFAGTSFSAMLKATAKQVDQVALHIPKRSHLPTQGQRAPRAGSPKCET